MPRKLLIRSDCYPYHVTARTNNKETFPLEIDKFWKIIGSECHKIGLIYGAYIHAFVLMPNHIHMLITTPEKDLGITMHSFMLGIAKTANLKSCRSGHLFGGPYYWSLIQTSRYFGHALKYVYRNPVKAGLTQSVENYPYSTIGGLVGNYPLPFPIYKTRFFFESELPTKNDNEFLGWLNTPFTEASYELIKQGLKKKQFEDLKDRLTRKPYPELELQL